MATLLSTKASPYYEAAFYLCLYATLNPENIVDKISFIKDASVSFCLSCLILSLAGSDVSLSLVIVHPFVLTSEL